jgi:hypothetical protein
LGDTFVSTDRNTTRTSVCDSGCLSDVEPCLADYAAQLSAM